MAEEDAANVVARFLRVFFTVQILGHLQVRLGALGLCPSLDPGSFPGERQWCWWSHKKLNQQWSVPQNCINTDSFFTFVFLFFFWGISISLHLWKLMTHSVDFLKDSLWCVNRKIYKLLVCLVVSFSAKSVWTIGNFDSFIAKITSILTLHGACIVMLIFNSIM